MSDGIEETDYRRQAITLGALTREQVEEAFNTVYWHGDQQGTKQREVLDGVDTLRATVEQQAQELARMTKELEKKTQWLIDISQAVAWNDAETLAQAVATVVKGLQATLAKREDELEAYAWTISPAMAQAKIEGQNQQLAKAALSIQELQATLAAREARIAELEEA